MDFIANFEDFCEWAFRWCVGGVIWSLEWKLSDELGLDEGVDVELHLTDHANLAFFEGSSKEARYTGTKEAIHIVAIPGTICYILSECIWKSFSFNSTILFDS